MADAKPSPDPHVTLHEERLEVRTVRTPVERLLLRRRIVTEVRQIEVTVRREVLEIDRHPTDGASSTSGDTSRNPLVIVLSEEVPVVSLETRPYERVQVTVDTVTAEQRVEESLAQERVDIINSPAATP